MNSSAPLGLPPDVQSQLETLISSGWDLRLAHSFELVGFMILLWEHVITIDDEAKYMWNRRVSPVNIIFLLNRYFMPPAFTFIMVLFLDPNWTETSCNIFARFEGCVTLIAVLLAELLILLRISAVYNQDRFVTGFLVLAWLAQLLAASFTIAHSQPVVLPQSPVTFGCILFPDPHHGKFKLNFFIAPMIYDSLAFGLLFFGIIRRAIGSHASSSLGNAMVRDGFFCFICLLCSNTAWTVTNAVLRPDLQELLASPATALTVVLVNRITINLKKHVLTSSSDPSTDTWAYRPMIPALAKHSVPTNSVVPMGLGDTRIPEGRYKGNDYELREINTPIGKNGQT